MVLRHVESAGLEQFLGGAGWGSTWIIVDKYLSRYPEARLSSHDRHFD